MSSKNPRNASGKEGEKRIKDFLVSKGIDFIYAGNENEIDFRINTDKGILYVDSKNQNTGGSTDEKLPHMTFKYAEKYKTKHIMIVRGKQKISGHVYHHLDCMEKYMGIKTEIITFDEFKNLFNYGVSKGTLESCMN